MGDLMTLTDKTLHWDWDQNAADVPWIKNLSKLCDLKKPSWAQLASLGSKCQHMRSKISFKMR